MPGGKRYINATKVVTVVALFIRNYLRRYISVSELIPGNFKKLAYDLK
jgi:hypothetical protein